MNWRTPHMIPFESGDEINPVFYDDLVLQEEVTERPMLLVVRQVDVDFDEYLEAVTYLKPFAVVAPFNTNDAAWTSRAAERSQGNLKEAYTGVVVSGKSDSERLDFMVWAQEQGYAPIVLLPHARKSRSRQLNDYYQQGYINKETWVHLAGRIDPQFDCSYFTGIYTLGEELW